MNKLKMILRSTFWFTIFIKIPNHYIYIPRYVEFKKMTPHLQIYASFLGFRTTVTELRPMLLFRFTKSYYITCENPSKPCSITFGHLLLNEGLKCKHAAQWRTEVHTNCTIKDWSAHQQHNQGLKCTPTVQSRTEVHTNCTIKDWSAHLQDNEELKCNHQIKQRFIKR